MVKFNTGNDPKLGRKSIQMGEAMVLLEYFEVFGKGVVKLTMEKVFDGYLLLKKKRYAGLKYNSPDEIPKVHSFGSRSLYVTSSYSSRKHIKV